MDQPAELSSADKAHTLAHNLRLKAELLCVARALSAQQVDFIVLKGVPLAERVFGGLAARSHPMQDNDILVRQTDLERAIAALRAIGYEMAEYRTATPRHDIEFEMKLQRVEHGVPLLTELHWHAFPPLLYPTREDLLWRHTESFKLADLDCKVFDPPLTLLQLASHFIQHLGKADWVLRDFAASYTRWRQELADATLSGLALELGLSHVLSYTFEQAVMAGLLESVPASVRTRRASLIHAANQSNRVPGMLKNDYARLFTLALLAEPQRLPRWLARQVFPPIEVMALIYQRRVSPDLYWRYASRLLRPIARLKGARRTDR